VTAPTDARPRTDAAWRNRITGHAEVAPDQLLANPANWRTHPREQLRALAAALGEVGWVAQVLVNTTTGHRVDGHLRVELALSRNEPTVPVTYVELTAAEEQLVLATLDPLAAMATAEKTQLEALLAGLTPEVDVLAALLRDIGEEHGIRKPVLGDPDEVPAVPDETEVYVKPGDLWLLGEHRLLCGDATDASAVTRLFDGELADCLWTDPPYGVEYEGKTRKRLPIENDEPTQSDAVVLGALKAARVADSAPFYIAAPAGPRHISFHRAVEAVGWRLHQELVWVKDRIVLGHTDWHYAHEPLLYGYTAGSGRPGRGNHAGSRWHGDNSQSSVLLYPKPAANRDHPTQKPVGLVEHCLRNSSALGDLVYDPFLGSGTTLIAAETLGRRCHGLEIEPRYAQVVIERWQGLTGRVAQRIHSAGSAGGVRALAK
jgi:DNA modification methylase